MDISLRFLSQAFCRPVDVLRESSKMKKKTRLPYKFETVEPNPMHLSQANLKKNGIRTPTGLGDEGRT